MSHNLFNERFYSLRQIPWHGLGVVSQEEMGAQEAYSTMTGYDVKLEALRTVTGIDIPNQAIIREPVPDDPVARHFATVGPDYTLVTPLEVCTIFDEKVGRPVETIGALGYGETFFLTVKLPDFDVRGDPVENYMLVTTPYNGWEANTIRVTPIRVVCQNTLSAAKSASTEVYSLKHDKTLKARLSEWMDGLYERALVRAEFIQMAFGAFASTMVNDFEAGEMLRYVYPNPNLPRQNAPDHVMKTRMENYEITLASIERSREAVMGLFQGAGTGLGDSNISGTGWSFYNAVTEWEDYRGRRNDKGITSAQINALFGDRATSKERAFSAVADLVGIDLTSTPVKA